MSVIYEVREHLTVADSRRHREIVELMAWQLGMLGPIMMADEADVISLEVVADGRRLLFSGSEVTPRFHELLRAIRSARVLEVHAAYRYTWRMKYEHLDPGPFAMSARCRVLGNEGPKALEGLFYAMYHIAGCSDGAGALAAFGEKNGRFFNGRIEPRRISAFPEGGIWSAPRTAVAYEEEDLSGRDAEGIRQVCEALCAMSGESWFESGEEGIRFFLDGLTLESREEYERFVRLAAELIRLTEGECGVNSVFVDHSGPEDRILELDIGWNGACALRLAAA